MHKWIGTDGGSECYRCGIALDYGARDEFSGVIDDSDPRTATEEEAAHMLAPLCTGPSTERAHHYVLEASAPDSGAPRGGAWRIACAYGDATIGPDTEPQTINAECVGA